MRCRTRILAVLAALALGALAPPARCEELPEYRLKAAFLYNFALFTEWGADVGPTLNLCLYGRNPFGEEVNGLEGKAVGDRHIAVHRITDIEPLKACQLVFIADAANGNLPRVLASLRGAAVLTVADSQGAVDQGVVLNMNVVNNRVTFEANLAAARDAKLSLSSKLLRLATKVRQ
jgi:hypothetical protein